MYQMSEKSTTPKLDIFDELANADRKNLNFYRDLSPELQKQFSSYVAMRWFSGVGDKSQWQDYCVILVNELLNINFSAFSKEPELQWKLLAACGPGKVISHQYIKPPKKRKQITKIQQFMLQWYPGANDDELDILTKNMDRDAFENFIKSTGATDGELKELLSAHDEETGFKPEKTTKGKKRQTKADD